MTTTEKGIVSDIARGADWLVDGNNNWTRLRRMVDEQWGPRPAAFSGLTYAYFGGTGWSGSAWTSVADGTIALSDNATNYIERTLAGVVSTNTSGFTASKLPMAVVTTVSGDITAIAERRMPTVPTTVVAGSGDALTTNPLSQFASTTSAQLRGVLSDETGTGAAVFADSPTLVNPVVGTQSPGDNTTKGASTAFVAAAIAALIGTAPGVLDTLGEISDAINDDANLYTTLVAAIALKASLAGATFTGDINVPDEAYDATAWNGSTEAPTKNAIRDKIESLSTGAAADDASAIIAGQTFGG